MAPAMQNPCKLFQVSRGSCPDRAQGLLSPCAGFPCHRPDKKWSSLSGRSRLGRGTQLAPTSIFPSQLLADLSRLVCTLPLSAPISPPLLKGGAPEAEPLLSPASSAASILQVGAACPCYTTRLGSSLHKVKLFPELHQLVEAPVCGLVSLFQCLMHPSTHFRVTRSRSS
jgi:hypothetical protein